MNDRTPTLEEIAVSDHDCPQIHAAMDVPYAIPRNWNACTWHGPARLASPMRETRGEETVHGLACPCCGAPLIETFAGMRPSADAEPMMRWSEGKCFPDYDTMVSAYRQAIYRQAMAGEPA